MAFTVETGTGIADANAYDSVDNIDAHHADRGTSDWTNFSTPQKEQAIVRASDYIDKRFGRRFVGVRATKGQGLEWPRLSAFDQDGFLLSDVDSIPRQLLKAVAEYALRAAVCGILAPDPPLPVPKQDPTDMCNRPDQEETGQLTRKREKVGPLEEDKWFETTSQVLGRNLAAGATGVKSSLVNDFLIPEYPEADLWLEELLRSSMNIMLARGD
jgi:hypothetical protein